MLQSQPWTQSTIENVGAKEKEIELFFLSTVVKKELEFQISRISDFDHDLLATIFPVDFRIVRPATQNDAEK